jgi:DNA (cytosine-5)-methyltransferase 1
LGSAANHEDDQLTITCIDAFCGAGGLSLGLSQAGFDVRAAFDFNPRAIETYRHNLGAHGFQADASLIAGTELKERASVNDLDLFAGGPPCQGFSPQKRDAHLGDERNGLVLQYLRLLTELRPKAFLLENVAQLAQVRGRRFIEEFNGLDEYSTHGQFYLAADYGMAQTRKRFVLVGIRNDQLAQAFIPPPARPWLTVGNVIGDLPEPPDDYTVHSLYPNHRRSRVTAKNIERFSHVPQGGGWQDIPFDLQLPCHQRADTKNGGWPDVYGRLKWDGQCPTITGGFDSFSRGRYGHPIYDRPLTPREAARLQGFPDSFAFLGTNDNVRHQIGNAVPVPLAKAIGISILQSISTGNK